MFTYATCTALTSRILLTCAHSVYSYKDQAKCSLAIFYPGVHNSYLNRVDSYISKSIHLNLIK